jgi:hypothetical protein
MLVLAYQVSWSGGASFDAERIDDARPRAPFPGQSTSLPRAACDLVDTKKLECVKPTKHPHKKGAPTSMIMVELGILTRNSSPISSHVRCARRAWPLVSMLQVNYLLSPLPS